MVQLVQGIILSNRIVSVEHIVQELKERLGGRQLSNDSGSGSSPKLPLGPRSDFYRQDIE